MKNKRIGVALTGSFCTLDTSFEIIQMLIDEGSDVTAIISDSVNTTDTIFGKAENIKNKLTQLTGKPIIKSITDAEPIGPKQLLDILVVIPATGNTIAKIALGITDTPVAMAVKAHLRNGRPVVLGLASNDALGNGAKNIGQLLVMRNIYFVPFGQDHPHGKPRSMVFKKEYVTDTIAEALKGRQLQPILA
ncbi:MAG: dipicolinate synthase subunit B [Defluviitaleaceae bacterium]|nr:dipicolinate synthase subunit B [Defluviitaleaceae bacterium]